MESLLALSVQQPWADMIVRGVKTIELRTTEFRHRGLLVLHTSLTVDYPAAYLFGYWTPWTLPRQSLIGVVDVVDVIALDAARHLDLLSRHRQPVPRQGGTYGLVLTNPRLLPRPLALKGRPFPFRIPTALDEQVRQAIAAQGA